VQAPEVESDTGPKPGYQTTEFWLSLAVVAVAATAALVQVYRGQLDATGATALVSSAVAALGYSHSRAIVKSQSTEKASGP